MTCCINKTVSIISDPFAPFCSPKMYVIRPQFFLPMISILAQTSKKALAYKRMVADMQRQTVDVTTFEEKLEDFREKFGNNYRLARDKFAKAIAEIKKLIVERAG